MKLVVGLGNPGIEYQVTPHNAGFLAVDRIAQTCGAVLRQSPGPIHSPQRSPLPRTRCPARQAGDLHEPQRPRPSPLWSASSASPFPRQTSSCSTTSWPFPLGEIRIKRARIRQRSQRGEVHLLRPRDRRVAPHPHRRRQASTRRWPRNPGGRQRIISSRPCASPSSPSSTSRSRPGAGRRRSHPQTRDLRRCNERVQPPGTLTAATMSPKAPLHTALDRTTRELGAKQNFAESRNPANESHL